MALYIAKTQTIRIAPSVAKPLMVHPAAYAASSSPVPRIASAPGVLFRQCDMARSLKSLSGAIAAAATGSGRRRFLQSSAT
jgi:hypothetical protein